jgi:LmbE family N-acetylglucosaminyl deacetylase
MAIGAHQDDIEIIAFNGILECFRDEARWFCGVVVTDGAGAPRNRLTQDYAEDEMVTVRRKEQKKAAVVGEYGAQVFLDYPSSEVRDSSHGAPVEDLVVLLELARPEVVYTHNLADKHSTHVAVSLRVIEAIRRLPAEQRPRHLYGCEAWRNLDWLRDTDKVAFDVSGLEYLQAALLGVFDSQIYGKRYDLATLGRRRSNATYYTAYEVDETTGMAFAMDLSPLIRDPGLSIQAYVQGFLERFGQDVMEQLRVLG